MDELVAWLRQVHAADEKAAREAAQRSDVGDDWETERSYTGNLNILGHRYNHLGERVELKYVVEDIVEDESAIHIARHDPRDVLAGIDGERAILEAHVPREWPTQARALCPTCARWDFDLAVEDAASPVEHPCPTLRGLAFGYRNRDGWQEGWAP